MKVYVVLMRRWGDTETHSYIHDVYSTLETAICAARAEEDDRGGKYIAYIEERDVDPPQMKIGQDYFIQGTLRISLEKL
jgi:hypothetical protein